MDKDNMDTFNITEIEKAKLTFTFYINGKKIIIEEEDLTEEQIKKIIELINE